MKIKCIDKVSKVFPVKLKKLTRCPEKIFVIGNESILSEFSLAVIGSRKCSALGKSIARDICLEVSKNDIPIVSGLARGIDTVAHNACIENKARTIAVLGGGHERIYPKENESIINKIVDEGGVVVSEYPPRYPPLPCNFRERNRIIAAISDGIVLIEAQKNSGSMITIKYAKELNKKIFAVPGCLDNELYEGSNFVLSEGAYCIRNAKDIFNKYHDLKYTINEENNMPMNAELKNVYQCIGYTPKNLEQICIKSGESLTQVMSKLTLLEIDGFIVRMEGSNFMKLRKRNL